ncbi:NAD-dependent epimerase/dehydratase family protein [Streptomyces poonensis]|uniref:NAD-dependent dehydratase n=1 Tax=Streptomyces poonensis TaxID=68255 RepID=A0A918PY84_9ACTN|nr:SDR family oxidoreductase [Streptomyces poonensis]GGZ24921.1 NAD-dependent dehydratase [Streptomyces poonensis]GLJ93581.1 NAD-dependent dehydratase [Streptomyces poonensis]
MKIFLAGNRGYLGSVLERQLLRDGHEVIGLDTGFFDAAVGAAAGTAPPRPRKDVRRVTPEDLAGCDAVVNLAALCNDACGELSVAATHQINAEASVHLARQAKALGIRSYVLASSCSVYGAARDGELTEEDAVAPETAYAASKVRAEHEVLRLADGTFTPVALRFATLFGDSPSFRSDLMVNRIALTAGRWGEIRMNGEGLLWRPLLHVRDAARAVRRVLAATGDRPAGTGTADLAGEIFNVGFADQNHRIVDVVEMARALLPGVTVTRTPAQDNRSYAVRFDKFHTAFTGFRSTAGAADGLREVVDAYRQRLRRPLSEAGDGWAGTDRREWLLARRAAGDLDADFHWNAHASVVA